MTALVVVAAVALYAIAAVALRYRRDAAFWRDAYDAECARHDKTCDDLAAVLWTVQIAASEIEPVAANAGERFCCD